MLLRQLLQMPSQLRPPSCQLSAPVLAARFGSQCLPPRRGEAGQTFSLAEVAAQTTHARQADRTPTLLQGCWAMLVPPDPAASCRSCGSFAVLAAGVQRTCSTQLLEESGGEFPASHWGTQAWCWQGQRGQRQILCRYEGGIVEPDAFKAFGRQKTSTWLYIHGVTSRGIRDL